MKREQTYLAVSLALAEVLLILISWLLSATSTEGVRSLLSNEGVRWFFGHFVDFVASPLLVWLLLLSMAAGCMERSGVVGALRHRRQIQDYRQRVALRVAGILLLAFIAIALALVMAPHALLLSATGCLFPSPFSRSLVPILSFAAIGVSTGFGLVAGTFHSLDDVTSAFSAGLCRTAPVILPYILGVQLYESLRFVFVI